MKRLIVLTLATLISSQAMATDYVCKEAYESRLDALATKQQKQITKNDIAGFGGGFLGGAIALAGAPLLMLPVFMTGGLYVIISENRLNNKIQSFGDTQNVLTESVTSREEAMEGLKKSHAKYYKYFASMRLETINLKRVQAGMPVITFADYIKENPIPDFRPSEHQTAMDKLTAIFQRTLGNTYEEVASAVKDLAQTDDLCPDNKPVGYKQLVKMVKARL